MSRLSSFNLFSIFIFFNLQSWKARAEGYKECIKLFPTLDEKSSQFSKYLGLMKKFVTDSNELNRIQAVEAANLFVQNAHVAGK